MLFNQTHSFAADPSKLIEGITTEKASENIIFRGFFVHRLCYYSYFTNFSPIGKTVLPAKSLIIMPAIIYHAAKAQIISSIAAMALS